MYTANLTSNATDPVRIIVFDPLYPQVAFPVRATALSAGRDAVAYLMNRTVTVYRGHSKMEVEIGEDGALVLFPGWRAAVPLGFKAKLPTGWECQVRSRSGLALKQGLVVANAPGTIDCDYPDEWMVILQNTAEEKAVIQHGDRIAQLVLAPVYDLVMPVTWVTGTVGKTTDRNGGFGSTGV